MLNFIFRIMRFLVEKFCGDDRLRSKLDQAVERKNEIDAQFDSAKARILRQETEAKERIAAALREREENASAIDVDMPVGNVDLPFRDEHGLVRKNAQSAALAAKSRLEKFRRDRRIG